MISFSSDLLMGWVVRLEHLGTSPTQVVDQRFQRSFTLGRAAKELAHFLHPEGGVQMTDRMRCHAR
jgi:hypothetical protein